MAIKVKMIDDVAVIKARGTFMGGEETLEVRQKVKSLVSRGTKKIILDMAKVKWMNSHGLGMLMACYSSVQKVNGDLKLSRVPEKVEKVLNITKVITLFERFDTLDQAVASIR